MICEVKMFGAKCDNCGEEWDNVDGVCAYGEADRVRYSIEESEWHITEDKKTYCRDCYSFDNNDNLIIKALPQP